MKAYVGALMYWCISGRKNPSLTGLMHIYKEPKRNNTDATGDEIYYPC